MENDKIICWYVMRAYKAEEKAEKKLAEYGIRCFIPKRYIIQKYHKKNVRRLIPIIPSLIFVHATRNEILEFKKKNNFLQFAMLKNSTGTEYIIVRDQEMDNFIKVASQYNENLIYYKPSEINLKQGMRVRIIGGILEGLECIFLKRMNSKSNRIVVMLDDLIGVSAEVNPDFIQILS